MSQDQVVAEALYEHWRRYTTPRHFAAIRARVQELLKSYSAECVIAVARAQIDDHKASWAPWKLSAEAFAWWHDTLNVPQGAWRYHLWLQNERINDDPERRGVVRGLVYWLDMWADGAAAGSEDAVRAARRGLQTLEENHWPRQRAEVTTTDHGPSRPAFAHVHDGYPPHPWRVKDHEGYLARHAAAN